MVQKNYRFHTREQLSGIIQKINSAPEYEKARGVLIQLYNPKVDSDDDKIIEAINSGCEKAVVTGITCANIADPEYDISAYPIQLNVTYFEKTRVYELCFDMETATGFEAGLIINRELQNVPNAKCIQVCYSCNSTKIHAFTDEFRHHALPMFGAKAGRSIRALNPARAYGDRVYENGIVAVIFESESLHLHMDNCLGFQEIGVKMMITGVEGDNVITTIDHQPAVDVYSKYLNVKPNRYFVQNVCEFPLVFHREDCVIARVPAAYGEKGEIIFTSDVTKGDTFRLSYGTPDGMVGVVERSMEAMKAFRPEAVYLFECGNRVRFLKNETEREIGGYLMTAPNASVAVGYAELFLSPEGNGGALNSALVAVGLTEEERAEDEISSCVNDRLLPELPEGPESNSETEAETREYVPFVDRILYFLERTSLELNAVNKELGKIAYTDQLTKIYNRWELEHKLSETLQMFEAGDYKASLIFMDIDHFKHVNDTYGHDAGDLVLKSVVSIVKDQLKTHHVFGRWGGEEFIYILPETDLEAAEEFAEELRRRIEENEFSIVGHVTMSFGVTAVKSEDTVESFVKRADEALYNAKETGRNRVVVRK
jgi:diguanylate cyclase (GGDEF)-like protein